MLHIQIDFYLLNCYYAAANLIVRGQLTYHDYRDVGCLNSYSLTNN